MKKKKVYKVIFSDCFGEEMFVAATNFDEADKKAVFLKERGEKQKNVLTEDGSIYKRTKYKTKSIELICDDLLEEFDELFEEGENEQ